MPCVALLDIGWWIDGPEDWLWRRKLQESLHPSKLEVVNESHLHAGHSGNPSGAADAETHFRHVFQPLSISKGFACTANDRDLDSCLEHHCQVPVQASLGRRHGHKKFSTFSDAGPA